MKREDGGDVELEGNPEFEMFENPVDITDD